MKREMMHVWRGWLCRQVTEGKLWNHSPREYNTNVVLVSIAAFTVKKRFHIPKKPKSWRNINIYLWYPHVLIYSHPISKGFWVQTVDLCPICLPTLLACSVNPTCFKSDTLLKRWNMPLIITAIFTVVKTSK